MTVGTGFFGRSALTENLEPQHLAQWTRLAYDADEPFGDFDGLQPWSGAPRASARAHRRREAEPASSSRRARRMILDELREVLAGALMAELRSSIFIDQLQPQTMCYLGTWIRGRLPRSAWRRRSSRWRPGSTSSR